MRLAVLGDVHGQVEALRRMLARVEAHGVDRLALLGDVVDRAPPSDSLECVHIAQRHRFRARDGRRRRLELVLGNHELNMLNFRLRRPQQFRDGTWGIPVPQQSSREVADDLTEEMVHWLDSRPRYISVQDGDLDLLLVHGGIRREHARVPGWLCKRETVDGLTRIGYLHDVTGEPLHPSQTSRVHWADRYEPGDGPLVVFGHTTFGPRITWFPNAIGVDCSKAGRLAGLILEAGKTPIELYEEHESTTGWLTGLCSPASAAR